MVAKRVPWSTPDLPSTAIAAGGMASGTDIAGAAFDQMYHVDNTTAANDSLVDAYEALRRDVKTATGTDLGNPMMYPVASLVPNPLTMFAGAPMATDIVAEQRLHFMQKLNELAAGYPAEAVKSWAQRDPVQDAEAIARASDENLAMQMQSRPGWDKYVYAFGGAAGASLRDPVTIGSLFAGGGPGGARTVLGRVLATAGSEALINAGTEAVMQPWVQDWRAKAGLDHGWDQAVSNVAFAAGLGGLFGTAGRGLAETVDFSRLTPEARAAMAPELRGAIDAGNVLGSIETQRPPDVSPRQHESLLAEAELAVHHQPAAPAIEPDDMQINRIVEALAPDPVTPPADSFAQTLSAIRTGDVAGVAPPRPIMRFVASIGGIDPKSPMAEELRAIGVTSRDMPGLFKKDGAQHLDNVPVGEAAEAFPGRTDIGDGNGYVSRQAFIDGMATEVAQRSGDITALAEQRAFYERRGIDFETMSDQAIMSRMAAIDGTERAYAEAGPNARLETADLVRQASRLAGPGVPDKVIRAAVDLHRMEKEPLASAVEWAMSDAAGVSRTLPDSEFAGSSTVPAPHGLDDPAQVTPEASDWSAELKALRETDPELADALDKQYGADVERPAALAKIVSDCPF